MSFAVSEIVIKNIKQLMTNYHIKQKELASMINIPTSSMSDKLNMKVHMDIDSMTDIANVFAVPVESLTIKDNFREARDICDLNDNAVAHIRAAIILRAIKDYCIAIRDNDVKNINECVRFFHSSWAFQLSPVPLDEQVSKIPAMVEKFKCDTMKAFNDGVITRPPKHGNDCVPYSFICPICGKRVFSYYATKAKSVDEVYKAKCSGCDFSYEVEPNAV